MKYYTPSRAITALYRMDQAILKSKLKELGISVSYADYLYAIAMKEGRTQQDLADVLMVSRAAVTQGVSNLQKNGLIEKVPQDGRTYQLYLTEKGRQIIPEVFAAFGDLVALHENALNEDEQKELERLIEKLSRALSDELDAGSHA